MMKVREEEEKRKRRRKVDEEEGHKFLFELSMSRMDFSLDMNY